MRVLVTGAAGFVGGAIARRLRAEGHTVLAAVRRPSGADDVHLDLADPARPALPRDVEAVVHAAAVVGGTRFSRDVMAVNAGGTRRMVQWARVAGVRHFVQISSIGAYGGGCVGEDRREDATGLAWFPLLPAYLRSKAQAERHVAASGLPHTILRLPGVFGARDNGVTAAIAPAIDAGAVPWILHRGRRISTLWVENAAAVVAAVLAAGPLGTACNVTDGEAPWDAFVATFAEALGRPLVWQKHGAHRFFTRAGDNAYQYLVTTGSFGAHFPNDRLRAALPGLALADWRDGVREAAAAWRAAHPG